MTTPANPISENICQACGGDNPVWVASNKLWNRVTHKEVQFLCPVCFIKQAESMGIRPTAWQLSEEVSTPVNPDLQNILLTLYHSYNGADGSEFPLEDATAEINQHILAGVLELIGESPPESEWWRYSGELLGKIQLRQELRAKAQERWGV